MGDINVVPYIDVMLVLLVIFMVTAPLLSQGVKVELPRAASEPVSSKDGRILVVTVKADGTYFVNMGGDPGEPLDTATAVARVAAARSLHPEIPVNVGGERSASYGKVVELIALLKQQGIDRIGFLTDPPER
jgi:biopolymer transport protein TolR